MRDSYDYLIVGAGLSGVVLAERLGSLGRSCLIVEKRDHIGGNCHDRKDRNGLFYHVYGPHYFRTNSELVRIYLSRFTQWHDAKYRVKVFAGGTYWSFPINLGTYRQFSRDPAATEEDFKAYLTRSALPYPSPANSKEAILSAVGKDLYELFYRGYTEKQWGRPVEALDASVCRRIPIHTGLDERYFKDEFQALPKDGYDAMFERMIEASKADVKLGTDYRDVVKKVSHKHLIYSGPLDEYFDCRFGALPYRTARYALEEIDAANVPEGGFVQPVLQVNYPGPEPFTRTVELKHVTGQASRSSNLVREFPSEYRPGESDPNYPIPGKESDSLATRYRELAEREQGVTFIGRLAQYRYLNMDQVVGAALHTFDKMVGAGA
ncbi:MAG TPA: UDP-galactopyranose mutase [Opitutaceae bacterium]|jgi:UDP-galactopyranose mutase|nr:UDP-galactopyranose mutase [Opitutaceae bacterium]